MDRIYLSQYVSMTFIHSRKLKTFLLRRQQGQLGTHEGLYPHVAFYECCGTDFCGGGCGGILRGSVAGVASQMVPGAECRFFQLSLLLKAQFNIA